MKLSLLLAPVFWYVRHLRTRIHDYRQFWRMFVLDANQYGWMKTIKIRANRKRITLTEELNLKVNPFGLGIIHKALIAMLAITHPLGLLTTLADLFSLPHYLGLVIGIVALFVWSVWWLIDTGPFYVHRIAYKNPVALHNTERPLSAVSMCVNVVHRLVTVFCFLFGTWLTIEAAFPGLGDEVTLVYNLISGIMITCSLLYVLIPPFHYMITSENTKLWYPVLGVIGAVCAFVDISFIVTEVIPYIWKTFQFQLPWWLQFSLVGTEKIAWWQGLVVLGLFICFIAALVLLGRLLVKDISNWWEVPLRIIWWMPTIMFGFFWLIMGYHMFNYNPILSKGLTITGQAVLQHSSLPNEVLIIPSEPPALATDALTEVPVTTEPVATEPPTTAEPIVTPPSFVEPVSSNITGGEFDKYTHLYIVYQGEYTWKYLVSEYKYTALTGANIAQAGYGVRAIGFIPKGKGQIKWVIIPPHNDLATTQGNDSYTEQVSISLNNMNDLTIGQVAVWRNWQPIDQQLRYFAKDGEISPSVDDPELANALSFADNYFQQFRKIYPTSEFSEVAVDNQ